jgi:hypothetical protein
MTMLVEGDSKPFGELSRGFTISPGIVFHIPLPKSVKEYRFCQGLATP